MLATYGLIACKKEKSYFSEIRTQNVTNLNKWDATVKLVALDVAQKLNNVYFRKMLKHEVCLRFDGDANILISSMMKRLSKYLEYEKNTQTASRQTSENDLLASFNFDILQQAAATFPQMQIAVQTDAEAWDAATFIPKVVYVTSDYNESSHTFINGFDSNQNPITVSTIVEPTTNHVVISQNERTILRSNNVIKIRSTECNVAELMETASYNPELLPLPIEPCNDGGFSGTGGGSSGANQPYIQYVGTGQDGVLPTLVGSQIGTITNPQSNGTFNRLPSVGTFNGTTIYRKDFKHEKMRMIRCDRLSQIESWFNGAPEIRLHVFEQNVLNPSENLQIFKEEFKPHRRRDIDGKWWYAGAVTMHLWDYQGTGTKASFGYYEYDPVLIPNEKLAEIGGLVLDILSITNTIPTGNPTQLALYGFVRQSVVTGIRSLKQKNGMSEYIGKDDYSIFNDEEEFYHNTGGTMLKTWPDL